MSVEFTKTLYNINCKICRYLVVFHLRIIIQKSKILIQYNILSTVFRNIFCFNNVVPQNLEIFFVLLNKYSNEI